MSSGEDKLPTELWRAIFKEATALPTLFSEYSMLHVLRSEHEALRKQVAESYALKRSLSMTCRLFHQITNEFLFEVIILQHACHIPSLVDLIRKPLTDGTTRGFWCKALYLHLWDTNKASWEVGRRSLWGLLEACPNVIDLRCSVVACSICRLRDPMETNMFYIPYQLLQQIACCYGPALKHFELIGLLTVHMDDLETFLSYCPTLEICRFASVSGDEDGRAQYDLFGMANAPIMFRPGADSGNKLSPTLSRDQFRWPGPTPSRVCIPYLCALDLVYVSGLWHFPTSSQPSIAEWILPSLHTLRTGADPQEYTYGAAEELFFPALTPHARSLKSFSYQGGGFDFWPLIELLECLEDIKVPVRMDFAWKADEASVHQHLRDILVDAASNPFDFPPTPTREVTGVFRRILRVLNAGKLPALRRVEALNHEARPDSLQVLASVKARYEERGVSVSVSMQTISIQVGVLDVLADE